MKIGFNGHSIEMTGNIRAFTAVAGAIVLLTTAMTAGAALWDKWGWTTPATHRSDVEVLETMGRDISSMLSAEVDDFRNEWRCENYRKELNDLLDKVDAGTANAQDRNRIDVLRQKMGPVRDGGLNCAQFED